MTPSLPQRGRQHAGSIPLTPFLSGFSINLLVIIALLWDARAAGAEAHCAEAQKSDWLFLFRISTERENHKKNFYLVAMLYFFCTLRRVVLIRFYQNKKMLFIINDTNFLMNGTTQAGSGDDRWRGTR
jgi:hypothetical protein